MLGLLKYYHWNNHNIPDHRDVIRSALDEDPGFQKYFDMSRHLCTLEKGLLVIHLYTSNLPLYFWWDVLNVDTTASYSRPLLVHTFSTIGPLSHLKDQSFERLHYSHDQDSL